MTRPRVAAMLCGAIVAISCTGMVHGARPLRNSIRMGDRVIGLDDVQSAELRLENLERRVQGDSAAYKRAQTQAQQEAELKVLRSKLKARLDKKTLKVECIVKDVTALGKGRIRISVTTSGLPKGSAAVAGRAMTFQPASSVTLYMDHAKARSIQKGTTCVLSGTPHFFPYYYRSKKPVSVCPYICRLMAIGRRPLWIGSIVLNEFTCTIAGTAYRGS